MPYPINTLEPQLIMGLGSHFGDLWKVDREMEELKEKQSVRQLRELQMQDMRDTIAEKQRLRNVYSRLPGLLESRSADLQPREITSTVKTELGGDTYSVPGPDQTLKSILPPKATREGIISEELWKAGATKEALQMEELQRKKENDRADRNQKTQEVLINMAKTFGIDYVNAIIKSPSFLRDNPDFKHWGNIERREDGYKVEIVKDPETGDKIGYARLDSRGKQVGDLIKIQEKKTTPTTKSFERGGEHITEFYREGEEQPYRTEKAPRYKPDTSGGLADELKAERLAKLKAENAQLENKMTPRERMAYQNAQVSLRNLENQKIAGTVVDDDQYNKLVATHKNTIENIESKYLGGEKPGIVQKINMDRLYPAIGYLKKAKDRNEAKEKIKSLIKQGWSRQDLEKAVKEAGWE